MAVRKPSGRCPAPRLARRQTRASWPSPRPCHSCGGRDQPAWYVGCPAGNWPVRPDQLLRVSAANQPPGPGARHWPGADRGRTGSVGQPARHRPPGPAGLPTEPRPRTDRPRPPHLLASRRPHPRRREGPSRRSHDRRLRVLGTVRRAAVYLARPVSRRRTPVTEGFVLTSHRDLSALVPQQKRDTGRGAHTG